MDYGSQYRKLIDKYRSLESEVINDYYESHHIIPRCMGGLDTIDNIVKLPPKAHFVSHHLLCKIYPDDYKLASAFNFMCCHTGSRRTLNINCKLFEAARLHFSKNHPSKRPESRERMSKSMIDVRKDPNYRNSHSQISISKEKWIAYYDKLKIPHIDGYPTCSICGIVVNDRKNITCSKKCVDLLQKQIYGLSEESKCKMIDGIKKQIASLTPEEKRKRLEKSIHSSKVDHIRRGRNISKSKLGKPTNQYEIMGRRFAAMTDKEFEEYLLTISKWCWARYTNLRDKWKKQLQ